MDRYDDLLIKAREEMMGKQPLRKGRDSKQLFSQVWEQVMKAPQDDPYGLMDSFAQERQEQQRQARGNFNTMAPQPADPFGQMNEGASLDSTGQQPRGMFSNFRQGRSETRDPNKTGMFGRAKQGISNFMGRFRRQPAEQETTQGTVESASGSPPTMEAQESKPKGIGVRESYIRTHGKEPADEWLRMYAPDELTSRQEEQAIRSTPPSIANKYRDVDPDSPSSRLAEMREEMGGKTPTAPPSMQSIYDRINNDMKPIEPQTSPTEAGLNQIREMGIDSQGRRVEPPKEMEETEPMTDKPSVEEMPTTRTGTRMPRGALPMPSNIETRKDRLLEEKVESRKPEPMADGGRRKRTFTTANERTQEERDAQHPEARYADGRLKRKKGREKVREKYSLMPEEMREEAPAKKKTTKPKAQRGKKPVKEDIEGAQVMREPAKPKKASAKKLVENTTKGKETKGQGVKPFPNKPTQKARQRPKNEKKAKVNEGNEAAAKARSEKRQEAKKKEAVSEPEDKTYTRYISGTTDKDYVNEVVEAARNGNASAISRLRNDKGDLVDHHGFSDDEIDEITG